MAVPPFEHISSATRSAGRELWPPPFMSPPRSLTMYRQQTTISASMFTYKTIKFAKWKPLSYGFDLGKQPTALQHCDFKQLQIVQILVMNVCLSLLLTNNFCSASSKCQSICLTKSCNAQLITVTVYTTVTQNYTVNFIQLEEII